MAKIYTIGETTYDVIFRDGKPINAAVGGSALNLSVTLSRLGFPVYFVSRMGNDRVGDMSLDFLTQNGISCKFVTRYDGNSRLALAFLDDENNAQYQFYKADKLPSLVFPQLGYGDIVTFGSTNALRNEGRNNLLLFLNHAHDNGNVTIYDPNIREFGPLELIEVRRKFEENLYLTKVLKGSAKDFQRIYDTSDADIIFEKVKNSGVEVLIVTSGANPVQLRAKSLNMSIDVKPVNTVSTIGAGDSFTAGLVYGFVKYRINPEKLKALTEKEWKTIIQYSKRFAAEVCKSKSNYLSNKYVRQIDDYSQII
jgi:fructokinase